jgi:hypothetical protein
MFVLVSLVASIAVVGEDQAHAEAGTVQTQPAAPPDRERMIQANYGKVPLLFEENRGQADADVKFVSRGSGYTLYLTPSEAVFSFKVSNEDADAGSRRDATRSDVLRMAFVSRNPDTRTHRRCQGSHEVELLHLSKAARRDLEFCKSKIRTDLCRHRCRVLWQRSKASSNTTSSSRQTPSRNRFASGFDGAQAITTNEVGSLVVKTANTELIQQRPIAFQEINGDKKAVDVSYRIDNNEVTFALGEYDRSMPLVIDPRSLI